MEIDIAQSVQIMEQQYRRRDFFALAESANAVIKKMPESAVAWRYLGIATLLSGEDGIQHMYRAATLGDIEAPSWIHVMNEFSYHPQGSIVPSDIILQVGSAKMRESAYIQYPSEVHIETHAICNAKCSFCPYPTMDRKGDRMPDTLIDKIINDLKAIPSNLPFTISPFKVNEPFLDKRIFDICEKINNELPNARLRLFTNGSPLTEKIVEKIAAIRNVTHLWISLNASEEKAYEALMQLPFYKTIEKLDMLHKRVEAGYPHPVLVSRVVDGSTADNAFRKFLGERYPLFTCYMIKRDDWTGQVEAVVRQRVPPIGCVRWYEVSIMASGKVALCCMDGEGKHVIGDVSKQSVLEIYNNLEYRKLRQFTFSRLAAASPCDTCAY